MDSFLSFTSTISLTSTTFTYKTLLKSHSSFPLSSSLPLQAKTEAHFTWSKEKVLFISHFFFNFLCSSPHFLFQAEKYFTVQTTYALSLISSSDSENKSQNLYHGLRALCGLQASETQEKLLSVLFSLQRLQSPSSVPWKAGHPFSHGPLLMLWVLSTSTSLSASLPCLSQPSDLSSSSRNSTPVFPWPDKLPCVLLPEQTTFSLQSIYFILMQLYH